MIFDREFRRVTVFTLAAVFSLGFSVGWLACRLDVVRDIPTCEGQPVAVGR